MKGLQLTKQGFEDKWWELVQAGLAYVKAYNDLEEWHFEKFGEYRYASYASFANTRSKKA
ncbi:MAG: hypothetical protein GY706_02080, partial [Bacteroides sp.]|nr:hypothetical protein [Bacteroides sp.]